VTSIFVTSFIKHRPSFHYGTSPDELKLADLKVNYLSLPSEGVIEGDTDGVSAIVKEDLNEGVNEGLIEGVTKGIQLELERVLSVIVDKPGVNASEVTEKIGKSLGTTERYISLLRQLGTIERKGVARTSRYFPSSRTAEKIKRLTNNRS
jgi:hypothetical protein